MFWSSGAGQTHNSQYNAGEDELSESSVERKDADW